MKQFMKKLNLEKLALHLTESIEKDIAENIIAGAAVRVEQEGTGGFERYYGKKSGVSGEALTSDTVFRLASMTKPVTAAAVLIQIQRGKIALDDPVSKFIPSFRDMTVGRMENGRVVADRPASEQIRVYNLLTHTSGLLSADPVGGNQPIPDEAYNSLEAIVNCYGEHIMLSDSPMERALYSPCAAFDVAGRLVELTSDMLLNDFLKTNLFTPLGMNDTTFYPDESQWRRMSAMHNRTDKGENVEVDMGRSIFAGFPVSYTCGGASLVSTLGDYSAFAKMLLDDGKYEGRAVLEPEMVELMRYPRIPATVNGIGASETWGLGVRVITGDPVLGNGCFGWSGAYGTHYWVDPVNRMYAVYMKNSYYDGGSGAQTARRFEKNVMASMED